MAINLEQFRAKYPNLSDDAIAELADVTLKVSGNQKTRKKFLETMKEISPDTPIPELDTDAKIEAALKHEREAREKLEKQLAERDFKASLESQKKDAKEKFGLSDEDFKKMEEMMTKGELPADYRFAPALYKQQTEIATPTNYGDSGYGPFGLKDSLQQDAFKGLFENEAEWANKTAHAMIDDFKKGRSPAF